MPTAARSYPVSARQKFPNHLRWLESAFAPGRDSLQRAGLPPLSNPPVLKSGPPAASRQHGAWPGPPASAAALWIVLAVLGLPFLSGCAMVGGRGAHTLVQTKPAVLPAQIVSNFFLVEAPQVDGRTYRFMIDTGSSATLVSPALATALRPKGKAGPPVTVNVRGADGKEVGLTSVTLRQFALGEAGFERVPALIYDFTDLSDHLGVRIDGVIGFRLFREKLLTLDYPARRLVIEPNPLLAAPPPRPAPHSATLTFNHDQATPLIPVQMGNESFYVLLDSGSVAGLNLNPTGLHPQFANGPRPGKVAASLAGDHEQMVGRLGQDLSVGTHVIARPVVALTDQLSSLGGELLRNFSISFDQYRHRVTLAREADGPVVTPPQQDTGLSFRRYPAYWKVLAVVPDTPAAHSAVQKGDLCIRVNGEPVAQWDIERYAKLLRTAANVTYTFIVGPKEQDVEMPVFSLVP